MAQGKYPCPKCGNNDYDIGALRSGGDAINYFSSNAKGFLVRGIPIQSWVCTTCGYLQAGVPVDDLMKAIKK